VAFDTPFCMVKKGGQLAEQALHFGKSCLGTCSQYMNPPHLVDCFSGIETAAENPLTSRWMRLVTTTQR
jgi:hypothetical protein